MAENLTKKFVNVSFLTNVGGLMDRLSFNFGLLAGKTPLGLTDDGRLVKAGRNDLKTVGHRILALNGEGSERLSRNQAGSTRTIGNGRSESSRELGVFEASQDAIKNIEKAVSDPAVKAMIREALSGADSIDDLGRLSDLQVFMIDDPDSADGAKYVVKSDREIRIERGYASDVRVDWLSVDAKTVRQDSFRTGDEPGRSAPLDYPKRTYALS